MMDVGRSGAARGESDVKRLRFKLEVTLVEGSGQLDLFKMMPTHHAKLASSMINVY